ncbi:MAG: polyprenyl synthetase family protein [Breznakia sp.]
MNKIDFEDILKHSLDYVKDGLVKEAALYSLRSGGKRIRPQLLFACLEAYHTPLEKGIYAAVALEMIHTYSLIHDDLPAMDNDDLRRGVLTCHKKYGEDIAILAGDALLSEAFHYANKASSKVVISSNIVEEFTQCAGLRGMIYGQELDIQNQGKDLTLEELKKIHIFKTAKLISVAFTSACYIAEHNQDLQTWNLISEKLGLLFQIQDDILDITSNAKILGKPIYSDAKNNKKTYTNIAGLDMCKEEIHSLFDEIMALLDTLLIDKEPLEKLLHTILARTY